MNSVARLSWDSDLLGMDVYSVNENAVRENCPDCIKEVLIEMKAKLAYIFIGDADTKFVLEWENLGAVLVDTKVLYRGEASQHDGSELWSIRRMAENEHISNSLYKLALESGRYSRFRTDKKMPRNIYEKLYGQWLRRSISGDIATHVFAAEHQGEVVGFVTAKVGFDNVTIGLIAVDEKQRGKNIGTKLLNMVENIAIGNGICDLFVATQQFNRAACMFYERCGYTVEKRTHVMHLWID